MDTALDTAPGNEPAREVRIIAPDVTVRAQHRGVKLTITAFVICIAALFVAAIAMSAQFTEHDGIHMWAMVLMGAVIITILLSAVFVPFLKELRDHH